MLILLSHIVIILFCDAAVTQLKLPNMCNMRRAWLCISDSCWVFVSACGVDFVLTLFKRVCYSYTILVLLCLNTPQHTNLTSLHNLFLSWRHNFTTFFYLRDCFMSVPLRLLYVNDWIIFACKNNNILAKVLNTEHIVIYIYIYSVCACVCVCVCIYIANCNNCKIFFFYSEEKNK